MVVRISDKTQNYSKVTKLLVKPYSKYCLVYFSAVLVILNDNEKLSKKNYFKQSTTSYSEVMFSLINRASLSSKLKGINCTFIATPPIKSFNEH